MKFEKKKKKAKYFVFRFFFFVNVNSELFGIDLSQKISKSYKNICFKAIKNGGKSKRIFQTWTAVGQQISGGWEVYDLVTMMVDYIIFYLVWSGQEFFRSLLN